MATKEQVESLETKGQKYVRHKYNDMYISREVIMSKSFRELTGTAAKAYLFFLTKRVMKPFAVSKAKRSGKGRYYIENNGEIQFTYREAKQKHGISRQAFAAAIDLLVRVGLIDIAKSGSGLRRDVSLYAISDRWEKYGTDEFIVKERARRASTYGYTKGHRTFSTQVNHTCPTQVNHTC